MANQMDSAASSEALRSEDSHYDFPIRINATRFCNANRVVRQDFASVRQLMPYLDLGLRKKPDHFFDRVKDSFLCSCLAGV